MSSYHQYKYKGYTLGLDATIYKTPQSERIEVQYWRKNWALNHWLEAENCIDKPLTIELMENLLEDIDERELSEESDRWTKEDWEIFKEEIENIIKDMKANETYSYVYNSWW